MNLVELGYLRLLHGAMVGEVLSHMIQMVQSFNKESAHMCIIYGVINTLSFTPFFHNTLITKSSKMMGDG